MNERGLRVRFIQWSEPAAWAQQDRLRKCSLTFVAPHTALTRTTQQRGQHDDQQWPESSGQKLQARGIDRKSLTDWLGAQRPTLAAQCQPNTCEQHYSKRDRSHLYKLCVSGRQVGLESKPKHGERQSDHDDNKQRLGDTGRKRKCQERCCDQHEASASNIA